MRVNDEQKDKPKQEPKQGYNIVRRWDALMTTASRLWWWALGSQVVLLEEAC